MKKLICILVTALMLLSMTACGSQTDGSENIPEEPPVEQSISDNHLDAWNGTWNNFYSYFEGSDLEEAYQILAGREGIPAAQVKARYLDGATYQNEIAAFSIENGTITFYTETQNAEGSTENVEASAVYSFVGDVADGNGRNWAHFKTDSDVPYSHLILLPAEADVPGETMVHFHFRYGNDLDTILASDDWYATMIAYDSDSSLIIGHMTYRETELANWEGTWNNFYSYFEDSELEKAYATLAERENSTVAEVKARYLEGRTYQNEIAAFSVIDETITFYSETQSVEGSSDNIIATASYTYAGEVTDDFDRTWAHFETDGDSPYPHLFLLPAEADDPGNTMLHFHFRYGSELEELMSAEGWYATMVRYDTTTDLLVGHMTFED